MISDYDHIVSHKNHFLFTGPTLVLTLTWWALASNSQAYVDPSVMTYTIQALAAVAALLSVLAWHLDARKVLFRLLKIDENANKIVEGKYKVGRQRCRSCKTLKKLAAAIRLKAQKEGTSSLWAALALHSYFILSQSLLSLVVAPLELVASAQRSIV